MSQTPDTPMAVMARGLARRMAQVRTAEERLSSFIWKEGGPAHGNPDGVSDATSWVARVLHVATEGDNHRLLNLIAGGEDATVGTLAGVLGRGHTEVADRVSALIQAGLVARDLESDRVGLTELGGGVVELVSDVAGRIGDRVGESA
ncbi:MAG: hypothetical protein LJF04_19130 [Gemmatimonadetes bacterium]|nr:hypothetical protein [Gemmatimonadota bacterium]